MISRDEIVEAMKRATTIIETWRNDESPEAYTQHRGEVIKFVSEAVTEACELVFELVDTMDIAPDAWELVLKIDNAESFFIQWAKGLKDNPLGTNPEGDYKMWQSWDHALAACAPQYVKQPEPIEALVSQNVSLAQIARIYSWYYPGTDEPNIRMVNEERAKPGTHYNPETWKPRKYLKHLQEIQEKWEKRGISKRDAQSYADVKRLMEKRLGMESKPKKKPVPVAPEPLDDLIRQRVSVKQIAAMKQISEEDVRRRAAELAVALDSQVMQYATPHEMLKESLSEAEREQDEALRMAQINTHPEAETVESRILAVANDGHDWKEIYKLLHEKDPTITRQKIVGVLKANGLYQTEQTSGEESPEAS